MIGALIGLQTATLFAQDAAFNLSRAHSLNKASRLNHARNAFNYKMANAQQNYYKKMLDKNIKRSFSTFA